MNTLWWKALRGFCLWLNLPFFTAEGQLIPMAEEQLVEAQARAQYAEQELERLRSQLKAQGIEPEP